MTQWRQRTKEAAQAGPDNWWGLELSPEALFPLKSFTLTVGLSAWWEDEVGFNVAVAEEI